MANAYIEAARVYHEITKHSYTSVRSGGYALDWENRPLPYKIYPDAGTQLLPRDLELSAKPMLKAIESQSAGDAELTLPALTRILFCANGLTRHKEINGEEYHFRAAASAGALYPVELYLAVAEVAGVEPGLYHFSPADLKLRGLRRGDWRSAIADAAGMRSSLLDARAILITSAIFWRSAWKYRARAYRYCFWDTGMILANLLAAANAEQIRSEILTAFVDGKIEALTGIDPAREGLTSIAALGIARTPAGESPEGTPLQLETIALSQQEVVYDDIVRMHRESRLDSVEEVVKVAAANPALTSSATGGEIFHIEGTDPADSAALGETILRRGSTRIFGHQEIAGAHLAAVMTASSSPFSADFPPLVDTYLIINAAEGLAAGAYNFVPGTNSFELLKSGSFRGEAGYLCLEQQLGYDCSALIVYMTDLERVLAVLGNRGYCDAHLEAGLRGGRAYLAAYSLDLGATGLTFYDDDTSKFFAAPGKSPLLMVAIGVPRSRTNAAA